MLHGQSGVYATFLADLFPTESRATGFGASYNLAYAFFGGLSPVLETLMWESASGGVTPAGRLTNSVPALLLVFISVVNLVACAVLRRLRTRGVLPRHLLVDAPARPEGQLQGDMELASQSDEVGAFIVEPFCPVAKAMPAPAHRSADVMLPK